MPEWALCSPTIGTARQAAVSDRIGKEIETAATQNSARGADGWSRLATAAVCLTSRRQSALIAVRSSARPAPAPPGPAPSLPRSVSGHCEGLLFARAGPGRGAGRAALGSEPEPEAEARAGRPITAGLAALCAADAAIRPCQRTPSTIDLTNGPPDSRPKNATVSRDVWRRRTRLIWEQCWGLSRVLDRPRRLETPSRPIVDTLSCQSRTENIYPAFILFNCQVRELNWADRETHVRTIARGI